MAHSKSFLDHAPNEIVVAMMRRKHGFERGYGPAVVCAALVAGLISPPASLTARDAEAMPAQQLVDHLALFCKRIKHGNGMGQLDGMEVFSGVGNIAKASYIQGMNTAEYDITTHADCDILTLTGLWLLVFSVFCIRAGGWLWIGLPCSSWIFLSRGSTGRRRYFVEGDQTTFVQMHNKIAESIACLIQVAKRAKQLEDLSLQTVYGNLF